MHFATTARAEHARQWLSDELDLTASVALVVGDLPFLLGPDGRFDIELNEYFTRQEFLQKARNTWRATARDLCSLFSFVHLSRGGKLWRAIDEDDLTAFYSWGFLDKAGPQHSGSTWNRHVASFRQFFKWATRRRHMAENPAVGLQARAPRRNKVEWITPKMYRTWRDVGLRGYTPTGEPCRGTPPRWAARNATVADMFVRTGLRLTELSGWAIDELPHRPRGARFVRASLAPALAKGRVGRDVYFPVEVLDAIDDYVRWERREAVDEARGRGTYATRRWTVLRSPQDLPGFDFDDRLNLLREGPDGLEPVALWVTDQGTPASRSMWQDMFRAANRRCVEQGVDVRCHPHLLRHTFSVVTLEQLQRGQVRALAEHTPRQRQTYEMIFGDPLRWVQMLLGHASYLTTMRYLHALQEIELRARIQLTDSDPLDTLYLADVQRAARG